MKPGRPSAAAAIGGAIGTSYHRCGRADRRRLLTGRRAEHRGVRLGVVGVERLCRLAGGDRAAGGTQRTGPRRRPPRLADLGARPADEDERSRARPHRSRLHGASTERARARASTCSSLCAAESATRSRDVPGGDGRRPDRGHEHPLLEQGRRRVQRDALVAEHHGHDRRGVPRAQTLDVSAEPGAQLVALGRAHDAQCGKGRTRIGRGGGGGEDVRTREVDEEVREGRGARSEPTQRAQCLGEGPDRGRRRRRRSRDRGRDRAPHGPRRSRGARRAGRRPRRALPTARRHRPSRTPCRTRRRTGGCPPRRAAGRRARGRRAGPRRSRRVPDDSRR